MKKFIARVLRSLSWRLKYYADYLVLLEINDKEVLCTHVTPHSLWLKDNGDKTLRLNYQLTSDDVVLDVGGYEGQWASDIFSRYLCKVHIFEPIPHYSSMIEESFLQNKHIKLHKIGLGKVNDVIEFSIAGDASSSIVRGNHLVQARIVAFRNWYEQNDIKEIALMKVNIEGGEYDLLEHLIETGLINNIKNLQVQFHDFFPDAEKRMLDIQASLQKTHYLTYQYKFIWENWTLKDQS
ncbi:FkbM family methyltransferase [Methylotenera mobilis]|uniref:Methyltransferase FkbM family n=1 Tax=Methylotenera mobilis (strain JLW8 / ATCC BAA-1282 / DSM 17540) TaxID=583345 RepID=C6WVJ0_METML|nr:FkbM family methyltransferase [Methylotenera mobilis]ACT47939.1 methyltransferase FkbM family [Methylotenera mobilis JLW8]